MTRGDALVLLLVIGLCLACAWYFWAPTDPPARVQIRVQGEIIATLPLNRDQVLTVDGLLGETEIEVRAGRVRFIDAPCSNKQCILRGWVERSGDMAACLPNRVSVSIIGQDSWFDAVNF